MRNNLVCLVAALEIDKLRSCSFHGYKTDAKNRDVRGVEHSELERTVKHKEAVQYFLQRLEGQAKNNMHHFKYIQRE